MTDRKSTSGFSLSAFVNPITIAKILSVFKFQVVEIVNYQNGSKNVSVNTNTNVKYINLNMLVPANFSEFSFNF